MQTRAITILLILVFSVVTFGQTRASKVVAANAGTMVKPAIYAGTVRGYGMVDYNVNVTAGSSIRVTVESPKKQVYFTILNKQTGLAIASDPMSAEVSEWSGPVDFSGKIVIRVFLMRADARRNVSSGYKLKISAETAGSTQSAGIVGTFVTDSYRNRAEGYDWVSVSIKKNVDGRLRISVRSRADRKRPTCTVDLYAGSVEPNRLVAFDGDSGIVFTLENDKLTVEPDVSAKPGALNFYCSGGASIAGLYERISGPIDAKQIDPTVYLRSFAIGKQRFTVEQKESMLNVAALLDAGPNTNSIPIKGVVTDAEIADLNSDGNAEIYVYVAGPDRRGTVYAFSFDGPNSVSVIDTDAVGDAGTDYTGGDRFAVVENRLSRQFPIPGGTRQIVYRLGGNAADLKLEPVDNRTYKNPDPSEKILGKWYWRRFETPVDNLKVPEPEKFTVEFLEDGNVRMQIDCNRGTGNYKAEGSQLTFSAIAATKMFCGPKSLDSRFTMAIDSARLFRIDGDNLYVDLLADGGTMHFNRSAGK